MSAVVKLQEKVAVETLARNVRDQRSPRYGKFYTPAEIRALSAPADADYANVVSALRQAGFKIQSESPTHLYISISGDSSVFERTFSVKIQSLGGGRHQAVGQATIPQPLAGIVDRISGLNSGKLRHPHILPAQGPIPTAGPGGIQPAAIKTAYGFDPIYKSGVTGKGQHIAVATYDGFKIEDVKFYYDYFKLKPSVDQVQFNGSPTYNEGSALETQLDAEFAGMIAPGSAVHVFASSTNDDPGELQLFTAILDDNRAKIANYSWGMCETALTPEHRADMAKVFARAVAQGVNIMVASGDSGSDSCQDGTTMADYPAASPDVVAVGGTTATISGTSLTETAWNGSGGGISAIWKLPEYQGQLGAPYNLRSYPDVAFNSDPASGQAVYGHYQGRTGWFTIGGTSMAAPQWSGFMALVGEARATAKKTSLGFLNPILYGETAVQAQMNDVASGSNGAYTAASGWDAVTGFGSMKAGELLKVLVAH